MDNVTVKKHFVEILRISYPEDPIMINYTEDIYLNPYTDFKLFYKGYVSEQILSAIITYDKMKIYYPIQIVELILQLEYVTPQKPILFEKNDEDPTHANLNVLIKNNIENKMVF